MKSLFEEEYPEVRSAVIVGEYRYHLTRRWGPEALALWIMLNPSLADAVENDKTVTRIIGFTRREGLGGFAIVNLFALISPYPKDLLTHPDPIGPQNMAFIGSQLRAPEIALVVCGWGNHRATVQTRGAVRGMLRAALVDRPELRVVCLGTNGDGTPKHPLYRASTEPFIDYIDSTDGTRCTDTATDAAIEEDKN